MCVCDACALGDEFLRTKAARESAKSSQLKELITIKILEIILFIFIIYFNEFVEREREDFAQVDNISIYRGNIILKKVTARSRE